jgi:outer membrane protein OmpA-like peptidoglycan-associated protein
MKKFSLITLNILIFSAIILAQNTKSKVKHNAFSGTLMLEAEAGAAFGFTDYSQTKPEIVGRGMLEYFLPTTSNGGLGIGGFLSAGYVGGKDDSKKPTEFRTNITRIGGGISYNFNIKDEVFPYVFLGASYGWINPQDNNSNSLPYGGRNFKTTEVNYHAETGVRFLLSDAISFDVDAGAELSPKDNWDAQKPSGNNDMLIQVMAGFSYSLFTTEDSDGDGVEDSKDLCPNTPAGVAVDATGCPLDADKDGVPDYKDKCPNTQAGLTVDENGCPIDADNDGVPDKYDLCPNTAPGVKVDKHGCPDTDGDGVYDDKDKCPDTPKGAAVDTNGCPLDSDGDGIPDYKDKCPNTPKGKQVDSNGCATIDTVTVDVTLSGDANFEFGKANLLTNAYPTLDNLAKTMKKYPNQKWQIIGYTDAIGSDSYNLDLSRRRAQAVANYLITKGVDESKLQIIPMGEGNPIASNKTSEGRAMNRRVEIKQAK